mgnify:CR=1 FL=1|jgi:hypothetical protein
MIANKEEYTEYKDFMTRVCRIANSEIDDLVKTLDVTKDQAVGLYQIVMIDRMTSAIAAAISNDDGASNASAGKMDSASGKKEKKSST